MKIKVYIAGPYSNGDMAINVREAFKTANDLAELGFFPFVPHYTHFWHMLFPHPYEFWLSLDEAFLICCDAVYRLKGNSVGADKEIEIAKERNIPVFYNINDLKSFFLNEQHPKISR